MLLNAADASLGDQEQLTLSYSELRQNKNNG